MEGPSPAVSKAMSIFGEKPYTVCDLGSQSVHADEKFEGEHLKLKDVVTIKAAGPALAVHLGDHELTATPSEDGSELIGEASFEHHEHLRDAAAAPEDAAATMLTHQVQITKNTDYEPPVPPAEGCDPARPIIDIVFCVKGDDGNWTCRPPGAHHLGDVHAQS
jgi:hypothetical protein